jgi:pre-rRNA-processing protein TSR3
LDVLILRDGRESPAKCSLTPLRGLSGVRFARYAPARRLEAGERVLLHPDGAELGSADRGRGLLLIDCAWRRVPSLLRTVDGVLHHRRLEGFTSAYPRRSKTHSDPARGLASVEALFVAALVLGESRPELLAHYRWREAFLAANAGRIAELRSDEVLPRSTSPPAPAMPY